MENITTGHWIFALIFLTGFATYLVWSYQKDLKTHKKHYRGSIWILLGILVAAIFLYLFKNFMK